MAFMRELNLTDGNFCVEFKMLKMLRETWMAQESEVSEFVWKCLPDAPGTAVHLQGVEIAADHTAADQDHHEEEQEDLEVVPVALTAGVHLPRLELVGQDHSLLEVVDEIVHDLSATNQLLLIFVFFRCIQLQTLFISCIPFSLQLKISP
jgi:hypothetical protein